LAKTFLVAGMLAASFAVIAGSATATQTCDPVAALVCTGDAGTDLYAHCDGNWVDVYLFLPYAQVCLGHAGDNHVCIELMYDGINGTCTADVHV
jgi:putative Ca2+/H+ antiporter (TMEM165/GDT1 family)